jgi:hypothetical protein
MTEEERQAMINYSITKSFLARTHSHQYKFCNDNAKKKIDKQPLKKEELCPSISYSP